MRAPSRLFVLVLVLVLGCAAEPGTRQEAQGTGTGTTAPLPKIVLPTAPDLGPRPAEPQWRPPKESPFVGATETAGPAEIVILHTNDIHGQCYPQKAIWIPRQPHPDAGGLSALASVIRKERAAAAKEGKGVLVLDAGDIWSGTAEGNLTEGRIMVHWMNLVGYDAMAVGNHEFDAGAENVRPLALEARFPWLAANLVDQSTGRIPDFVQPAVDFVLAGVKVAVIGVIASDTKIISSPRATRGLDFKDAVEAVREEAKAARARGAEVVLVLSHCGLEADRDIAAFVDGIDAIVGGHSHVGLDPAWVHPKTGVLVAATYSKGSTVGRVRLKVEKEQSLLRSRAAAGRKVTERAGQLIQVLTDEWPRDAESEALLAREAAPIYTPLDVVLGEAATDLRREKGYGSSAIGNWIADLMREHAKADVAIHNKAGIRADLVEGPVRLNDVYQVSPFGNSLVSMTLTGKELRDELEHALSDPKYGVEVSGIEVRYDLEHPEGDRVIKLTVRGEAVVPEKRYRVVTNSFLAKGGDGHAVLAGGEDRKPHEVDVMMLHAEDVRRRGKVRLAGEDRLAPAGATTPGMLKGKS